MSKTNKIIAIITAFAIIAISVINVSTSVNALGEVKDDDDCRAAIDSYWTAVDSGKWEDWVNSFAPSARSDAKNLISQQDNFTNNIGILTVSDAEIVSVNLVDDSNVLRNVYSDLEVYFESSKTYACYIVNVALNVKEENGFFRNGINSFMITLIKEDDCWGVGAMSAVPDGYCINTVSSNSSSTNDQAAPGSLYGFADVPSCRAEPDTISVKDENGTIHKNVSFETYLINVIYHEIGSDYPAEAERAHIVEVKTLSWCFFMKKPFVAYGYDISFGWVSFTSSAPASSSKEYKTISQYIQDVRSYYMATSSSTGSKLFFAQHHRDVKYGGKGSGVLAQKLSRELALGTFDGKKYTWKEILHYFFDNSKLNSSGSVGIVQFLTQGSHTYGSTYESSNTHHWKACSKCKTVKAGTYQGHTWVSSIGGNICSICKAPQLSVVDSVLQFQSISSKIVMSMTAN